MVGAPALIQQAYLSLKRGGAVVCVGVVADGRERHDPGMMLSLEEKSLLGCLYGSANVRRDMPLLLDLYMQKRLKIDELVSRRIKLEDVNAAFEAMEKGEVARSRHRVLSGSATAEFRRALESIPERPSSFQRRAALRPAARPKNVPSPSEMPLT